MACQTDRWGCLGEWPRGKFSLNANGEDKTLLEAEQEGNGDGFPETAEQEGGGGGQFP